MDYSKNTDCTRPTVYKKREGWYMVPGSFWVASPFGPFETLEEANAKAREYDPCESGEGE